MLEKTSPQELSSFFYLRGWGHEAFTNTVHGGRGVLVVQWGQLDLELIRHIAGRSGVLAQFEQLYEAARRETEG